MSESYSQITEPTTAVRASLRDLLQAQVAALELAPKWLWEIEFGLHIWPILERFHREGHPDALDIINELQGTVSVGAGIDVINCFLEGNPEGVKPW